MGSGATKGKRPTGSSSVITVKSAEEPASSSRRRPASAIDSYDKALFQATRHSFVHKMPSISEQLKLGVRGIELIVHARKSGDPSPPLASAGIATGGSVGPTAQPTAEPSLLALVRAAKLKKEQEKAAAAAAAAGELITKPVLGIGKAFVGDDVNTEANGVGIGDSLETWLGLVARWSTETSARAHTPITIWLSVGEDVVGGGAELCDINAAVSHTFGSSLFTPLELARRFGGKWPSVNDLTGRVLVVLGGSRTARASYRQSVCPTKQQPCAAMNTAGHVVVAVEGGDSSLFVWVGSFAAQPGRPPGEGGVTWYARRRIGTGHSPAISINDADSVVVVFQSGPGWDLHSLACRVALTADGELDLDVGGDSTPIVYGSGCRPTVAINNQGFVVAVHTRENNSDSLAWRAGSVSPGEYVVHWSPPDDSAQSGSKYLTIPRGSNPTTLARFDSPASSDIVVVNSYHRVRSVGGIARRQSMPERGSDDKTGRKRTPKKGSERGPIIHRPDGDSDEDWDDDSGDSKPRRTLVRGTVAVREAPDSALAVTVTDVDPQAPEPGKVSITWQRGIDLDATDEDRAEFLPTRNVASVVEGGNRIGVSVTCDPSTGALACSAGLQSGPLALKQVCFVEARKGEEELLSDPGVRFAGCAARDEAFGLQALEGKRVLRMWRFNAVSCARSQINPHFPATDDPAADWYQAFIDAV